MSTQWSTVTTSRSPHTSVNMPLTVLILSFHTRALLRWRRRSVNLNAVTQNKRRERKQAHIWERRSGYFPIFLPILALGSNDILPKERQGFIILYRLRKASTRACHFLMAYTEPVNMRRKYRKPLKVTFIAAASARERDSLTLGKALILPNRLFPVRQVRYVTIVERELENSLKNECPSRIV